MELTTFGAAGTVTGSKHMLEIDGMKILIDSGLFQGEGVSEKNSPKVPFNAKDVEAIFLTHAHLDHSGYLPVLVKNGFHGPIFSTHATKALAEIILLDSAKIQESDAKLDGKKKDILYDSDDVAVVMDLFDCCDFDKIYHLKNMKFSFHVAGHVLGAAFLHLDVNGKQIIFSGDLGREYDLLMLPPDKMKSCDYLVMESTYGDRTHPDENTIEIIASELKEVIRNNGVLLVPVFALARLQLFLAYLHEVFELYPELKIPAFVDSPMGSAMTKVYKSFNKYLRPSENEFLQFLESAKILEFSREVEKMHKFEGAKIIIASSGMISGGRIMNHVERLGKYESTTILLTGYQGKGTIGKELLEGAREIRINGHRQKIRAKVVALKNLSAHADKVQMLEWIRSSSTIPKKIFLVHGEEGTLLHFQDYLTQELGCEVVISKEERKELL